MKTINLTEKEFVSRVADIASGKEWKYLGDKPAIVDFYASWCHPCQITARVLDELAVTYSGEIYIYKVDISVLDSDQETILEAIMDSLAEAETIS